MRVFLGPNSIAGVEWEYRNGLRKLGVDANVILQTAHPFGYPYDRVLSKEGFASAYRGMFKSAINLPSFLHRYDIFHFSFGSSLLPFNMDVPILKKMKKGIVMTFLGSDIRCSKLVLEGLVESKNCNYCRQSPCRLERKVKRVNFWGRNADAIFSGVEMSDLLDFYSIPYHQIVLPIDLDHWKPFEPGPEYSKKDNEVLIVHAPSSPKIKGTPIIMDAVNKLKKVYPVKIKLLTGVPNHVVREWLNAADIVVDQISVGWHGKLSVESMALAKPTLCYINEEFKERFPQFKELPIVNITPHNLYNQLESLIIDENLRKKIGQKSRNYVENVHDSRIVCRNLLKIYENIPEK
jgi:glycosyltransferase involved in cell wall biosynthesis